MNLTVPPSAVAIQSRTRTTTRIPGRPPKVTVLIENVRHHVQEEEQDWFPEVRKAMGHRRLHELGERMIAAKSEVPRDPLSSPSATA